MLFYFTAQQQSPDGRFIPPAHLEPLGGPEKVKKKKKKKKIPGHQPWGTCNHIAWKVIIFVDNLL